MMPRTLRISPKSVVAAALLAGVLGCVGMPGAHAGALHSNGFSAANGFSFGQPRNFGASGSQGGNSGPNLNQNGHWNHGGPGDSGWNWNANGWGDSGAQGWNFNDNNGQNSQGWDFGQHSNCGPTVGSVPEPGSLALFSAALGLLGVAAIARRRART